MKKSCFSFNFKKILVLFVVTLGFGQYVQAFDNYYTKMTAVQTGNGKVYVSTSQTSNPTYTSDDSSSTQRTGSSTGGNSTYYLYAKGDEGYGFAYWSSDNAGSDELSTDSPWVLTVNGPSDQNTETEEYIRYAVFKPLPQFRFSADATSVPAEGGVVSASVAGMVYGEYLNSTSASTTATFAVTSIARGYYWIGWNDAATGTTKTEQTITTTITNTTAGSTATLTKCAIFGLYEDPESIAASNLTINTGDNVSISYTLSPAGCFKEMSFSSDDEGVATVDADGKVLGVGVGTATITITANKIDTSATPITKTITVTVKEQCATPMITFSNVTETDADVTLTTTTTGATIYYTINGATPTAGSTAYSAHFSVNAGDVIRAIAIVPGSTQWTPSEVVTKTYTAQKVATPSIVISGDGTISFTCSEEGAVTYTYCISDDGDCTPSTVWNGTPIAKNLANNEKIIKVIASKDGCIDSDPAKKQYTASGISGTTVILNDYEDHTWTYYAGVPTDVDGGNYNTNYAGKIYSPDPRNVKITYQANGGAVSISESETEFVYYKTIEKIDGSYKYQVISNPFSKRPTGKGFGGWEVVSGGSYIGKTAGDVLALDEELTLTTANLKNVAGGDYTPNCTSAEIVLKATWVDATIVRNTTTGLSSTGTYETNLIVLTNYTNNISPTVPCTIMMVEPDGTADYRASTFSGYVTPADLHDTGKTTKIEFAHWTPGSNGVNPQGRNFTIGRGMNMTGTARTLYGSNTSAAMNQVLKVESGTFANYRGINATPTSHTKQHVIFGSDYDRARNDNDKLSITGNLYGLAESRNLGFTNASKEVFRILVKSGKFYPNPSLTNATYNNSFYLWDYSRNNNGTRILEIEGGEFGHIAGGANVTTGDEAVVNLKIRMRGGTVNGVIFGGAAQYNATGSKQFVFTGGTVKGWIAGGSNGYADSSAGSVTGYSYVYIGGNVSVDSEGSTTLINRGAGGTVFGAGCGNSSTATSGQVQSGTNVVIADDAYVERGVYGGGSFGYCPDGKTSNIYVTGGTVDSKAGGVSGTTYSNTVQGGVYGGACQNRGGIVNVYMTGGQINGGLYGGSNASGTISGNVTMVITGGQVGTSTNNANIHGGGYGAGTTVSQNVDVTLGTRNTSTGVTSGTAVVYGDVYGGSALGKVNGTAATNTYHTNVTLNAGTIHGSIYGGALGATGTAANVYGPVAVKVYGGSVMTTDGTGENGSGAVYGANNINGAPQRAVTVDIYGTDAAPEGQYALYAVYGGGNQANYTYGNGYPKVVVHGCDNSIEYVYGGGNAAAVAATDVTIWGGDEIGSVFGGGNGQVKAANVTGAATTKIYGGTIGNVFGGSNTNGTIGGAISVTVNSAKEEGAASACTMNIGNVYGGGNKAASNVGTLNIGCTGTDGYIDAIYGGANAANITGNIALNITGGNIGNVFGGNNASGTISGKVDVTIGPSSDSCDGIQIANVYGGGNKADMAQNANVVTVNINGDDDAEIGNIYGGGKLASVYSTNVYLRGGTITGNVFGGGMGSKETTELSSKPMILNGGTHVYAFGGTVANIFGGNDAGGTINGGLNVIVDKTHADEATDYSSYSGYGDLEITGDVYGGGNEAASAAGAVNIKCANAIANVFGGAKNANVTGDIVLTVGSGQIGNVYGGNNVGGTAGGNITVNVSKVSGDCGNNFTVGNVFGGGYGAGTNTGGNVTVNITDVAITGDVYGGSALGNVNTGTSNTTAVNLRGGSVAGNVYGGGLGDATTAALVKGNVTVTLGNTTSTSVIGGSIYGANNVNGTPLGTVNVIVNKTAPQADADDDDYDVAAVYGGGNKAAYVPDASIVATAAATVTVNGCDNSIQYVYGGGNAAPVPATNVTIWGGTYDYVFAGGNGAGEGNPGANVGYKTYADDADEDTKAAAAYGSGNAIVNFYGGSVNHLFGGSNTKGNIKGLASVNIDEGGVCPLVKVDEAYAAGNEAYMEGGAKMNIGCVDLEFPVIYGGAKKADVGQDIVLNITSGKYQKVFGGNNLGGKINGSITVNVDETGCHPVTIGELYGGGNMAAYSIYGYEADGTVKTSGTKLYDDPVVNIVSCTSIGTVYGGGYGTSATVVGNPTVNINQIPGKYAAEIDANGDSTADNDANAIGTIGNIFGGGNAAPVQGNTFVNIGTAKGTLKHIVGDDDDDIMDLEFDESSANISGNVYGGGNKAVVTGNTKVVVGPEKTE